MEYIIIIGLFAVAIIYLLARFTEAWEKVLKNKADAYQLVQARRSLEQQFHEKFEKLKVTIREDISKVTSESTKGFPWLADALSEYYMNLDIIYAKYLETKPRPAKVQADKIKAIAQEKKVFKKEFLTTKYIIKYYEGLFPWLQEYVGFDSEDLINEIYKSKAIDETQDPVKFYLAQGEFENLSPVERNQKALDRYWRRDKRPWQIGRDYERYVGYLYESKGYKVSYFGADMGFEDLGRDLICENSDSIEIVQCKYWSKEKNIPIRENHINQLFGTTIQFYLTKIKSKTHVQLDLYSKVLAKDKIIPTIFTSTTLSDKAKEFSKMLGVKVVESFPLDYSYPSIKCNISQSSGEKIYHLPFDQQYDKVLIDPSKGERYVRTVSEAESLGFRRAWRWLG